LIDGRTLKKGRFKAGRSAVNPEFLLDDTGRSGKDPQASWLGDEQRLDSSGRSSAYSAAKASTLVWSSGDGLIADGGADFGQAAKNPMFASLLASKVGATTRERLQSTKVDAITTTRLIQFFMAVGLNDVRPGPGFATQPTLTFEH